MPFLSSHLGECYALLTALFWTVTALAFETASFKIGSLAVNIIRLVMALLMFSLYGWLVRGLPLPTDASAQNWFWLTLSGLVGFVFGDLFLFRSYTIIGSRFAMLVMALVPPMAAFFGWWWLNESMSLSAYLGMAVTLIGIAIAIISKPDDKKGLTIKLSPKGLLFAFGGALGQAIGLILGKKGAGTYDAFAATQIRIVAGTAGFAVLISAMKRWQSIREGIVHRQAMQNIALGSFFGPFLGVAFSLLAILHTETGIASTIMAIIPVLIIPPAILFYKHKVSLSEVIGAIISVGGVALFFIF